MTALTTGPIRKALPEGNRINLDIINEDVSVPQTVFIRAFSLQPDGTRSPFVSEAFSILPGRFAARSYLVGFLPAVEFQIDVSPSNDFSVTFTYLSSSNTIIRQIFRPELTEISALTPIS
ncbi:hypothetical protein [Mesobacillus maritimus]|uniref:hypothetical protein n=1 Tax=Mesobacillus maritimus TaxID=1643336 RepID=UPI00384E09B9